MVKVVILGAGNVGWHLILECMRQPSVDLVQIYSRTTEVLQKQFPSIEIIQQTKHLKKADIYLIALPDDVIENLYLPALNGLVVHTSGTKSYQAINAKKRGVFYPLQSFSKSKKVQFSTLPLCIETEHKEDEFFLLNFAKLFSNTVQVINGKQRAKLHLAAVFANNFSNRMFAIAYDLCKTNNIDFKILQPLLNETLDKAFVMPPHLAQTGPAVRNDKKTIAHHLSQLDGINQDIYKLITQSIQEKNG
ncbi:Rossmann-like and DUF2520 domain-containing protein [Ochrovirga pacifica]|uniref:Rossmann-like and DUF2520 domain-containing protein n=1 Tax=Ochrovirga pacifica TaxID=1042376 RepID=UPI0002558AF7|nr:Rossmann-like and DUF2520 domain-containing protein [Ochrovirga pacifica]